MRTIFVLLAILAVANAWNHLQRQQKQKGKNNNQNNNNNNQQCFYNIDGSLTLQRVFTMQPTFFGLPGILPVSVQHTGPIAVSAQPQQGGAKQKKQKVKGGKNGAVQTENYLIAATLLGIFYGAPDWSMDIDANPAFTMYDIESRFNGTLHSFILDPNHNVNGYFYAYYTGHGESSDESCGASGVWKHLIVSKYQIDFMAGTVQWVSDVLDFEVEYYGAEQAVNFGGGMTILNGALYLGIGASGCDANSAQDDASIWGKIHKIDLTTLMVSTFASGVKEPYSLTNNGQQVFGNDCGNGIFEEVNAYSEDNNYGYPVMDGPICMGASTKAEDGNGLNDCQNGAKFEPAIAIYNRYYGGSCSAGAAVYQGTDFPCLNGKILFSDLSARNYSFEQETGLSIGEANGMFIGDPTKWLNKGTLFFARASNTPAWDNPTYQIKLNYPTDAKTMFFRIISTTSGLYVSAGDITGTEFGAVYRFVSDAANPICICQ